MSDLMAPTFRKKKYLLAQRLLWECIIYGRKVWRFVFFEQNTYLNEKVYDVSRLSANVVSPKVEKGFQWNLVYANTVGKI